MCPDRGHKLAFCTTPDRVRKRHATILPPFALSKNDTNKQLVAVNDVGLQINWNRLNSHIGRMFTTQRVQSENVIIFRAHVRIVHLR